MKQQTQGLLDDGKKRGGKLHPRDKRRSSAISLGVLVLDRSSPRSLHQQIYSTLRDLILTGVIAPRAVLPSTRSLSHDLGVSRNTASAVFDQLSAEGLIETKVGSGTRVTNAIPAEFLARKRARWLKTPASKSAVRRLPDRARMLGGFSDTRAESMPRAFTPGVPAIDHFPINEWVTLTSRHWKTATVRELCSSSAMGNSRLRSVIAAYSGAARAASCTEDNVLVVTGAQQALDICARTLTDPGAVCWIENPGYPGARHAFTLAGLQVVPAPVDERGLMVREAIATLPEPRLIYVTPSHQYPLGGTLSLDRRIALLEFADRVGAWIVEDDYDSEFGYEGAPISCLQGLDASDRVVYIGSFNKTLFPALRLGFAVVPSDLVAPFRTARLHSDGHPAAVTEAVLADFIANGGYGSHLRRMRSVYMERRDSLIEMLSRRIPEIEIGVHDRGLHFVGYLPRDVEDCHISERARRLGVIVPPLSQFYLSNKNGNGLLFGFACTIPSEIELAVRKLAAVFEELA